MCVDRWVGEDAGCIDSGALLSRKTECHNASHSNKDEREMTVLSEPERERQRPHGITCMENMKHDARQHIYRTQTDRQTRPVVAKGGGAGKGRSRGLGLAEANCYICKEKQHSPAVEGTTLSTLSQTITGQM